ncbi:MAG: HlyD family efflux transporter periplasmic adaptor subunit [Caldisericia bacterium]|nr:HlyD family efflux transporter periplasmic adaptor subunit [Caldisericia bacterium]
MKRLNRIIILFLVIIFLFNYKKVFSLFILPQTYKIEKITESIFIRKEGIVLFNEDIIYSPYDGRIKLLFNHGDKIKKNSLVATVDTLEGEFKFYSNLSGILSVKFDNLDFSQDEINNLNFKTLLSNLNSKKIQNGDEIKIGEPIFKIIDNLSAFIYFENDENLKNFISGKYIYLKNIYNGEIFKGEIVENTSLLKIKFNKFLEYFLDERVHPFEIMIFEGEVIKIKESFIKNGGIYLKEDLNTSFVSIKNFKYIKIGEFLIFPLIEENKSLFDLIGKVIIK